METVVTRSNHRTRALVSIGAVSSLLFLAACGSDDDATRHRPTRRPHSDAAGEYRRPGGDRGTCRHRSDRRHRCAADRPRTRRLTRGVEAGDPCETWIAADDAIIRFLFAGAGRRRLRQCRARRGDRLGPRRQRRHAHRLEGGGRTTTRRSRSPTRRDEVARSSTATRSRGQASRATTSRRSTSPRPTTTTTASRPSCPPATRWSTSRTRARRPTRSSPSGSTTASPRPSRNCWHSPRRR